MLTGLRLGNFKAFGEMQHIPIKPLTLIFGANSSGKSSIIQGFLLACHANETGNFDVYQTRLGGEAVNLGGFRQFVHRRDTSLAVEIGTSFEFGPFSNCFNTNTTLPDMADLGCSIEVCFDHEKQIPFLNSCSVLVGSKLAFRLSLEPETAPHFLPKWHITELDATSSLFADHQFEIKWRLLSDIAPEIAREKSKQLSLLINEQQENLFLSSAVTEEELMSLLAERGVIEQTVRSAISHSLENLKADFLYHNSEIPFNFSPTNSDEDRRNSEVVARDYWIERIYRITKYLSDGFTRTPFHFFDNLRSGRDEMGHLNSGFQQSFA
ncbi:MAG: hypothetical protein JWN14_1841, partial [Chthonomonadales bacterium]|nr:hypothetical protein [Chthonomonadales bacterium]